MQIEDRRIEKRQIGDIGFINTNLIDATEVEYRPADTEANLLRSFKKNENKDIILFPYNFKWVFLSCAYSVSLIY